MILFFTTVFCHGSLFFSMMNDVECCTWIIFYNSRCLSLRHQYCLRWKKSNNSVAEPFKDVITLNMHPFTSTIRWLYKRKIKIIEKKCYILQHASYYYEIVFILMYHRFTLNINYFNAIYYKHKFLLKLCVPIIKLCKINYNLVFLGRLL